MNLQKAIKTLTEYQMWRLGNDDIPSPIPKVITEALDVILKHHMVDDMQTIAAEQIKQNVEKLIDKDIFNQATLAMEERYGSGCEEEIDAYFRGAKWMQEQYYNETFNQTT